MHRHWAGRGGPVWDRACSAGPAVWGLSHWMLWCASPILTLMPTHTGNDIFAEGAAAVSKSLEINSVLTVLKGMECEECSCGGQW